MIEIWRNICDYEKLYAISNFGRVLSYGKLIIKENASVYFKEKYLKPNIVQGYCHVVLYKDKKPKTFKVILMELGKD